MLDARRQSGFVRQCHGDLHLRNIVLLDGRPTLFDGVEFNDEIACTDVFYDLAFLLMDLWRRQLPRHANVVMNRYLSETGDADGLSLLPLFLSCRAAVRAKTSATAARLQSDAGQRESLQSLARQYLAMAGELLHPPRPSLIAIGGFSGSGKSTLALSLAPHVGAVPGAVVLRSDEIRKRLSGVSPLEHLDASGYSPLVNERVYTSARRDRGAHPAQRPERHRRCGPCPQRRPAGHRARRGERLGAICGAMAGRTRIHARRPCRTASPRSLGCRCGGHSDAALPGDRTDRLAPHRCVR